MSGALPPLYKMRKRIHGTRGQTILGPVRMAFEVRGNELHYRAPFSGLVDVLEPDATGEVCQGRATFKGNEFGTFEMRRAQVSTQEELEQQLVRHIDEALAMEQNVV
ncbi:MAG: hypothetical protein ACJ74V_14335, partial [Gaiellaceae bacterium]